MIRSRSILMTLVAAILWKPVAFILSVIKPSFDFKLTNDLITSLPARTLVGAVASVRAFWLRILASTGEPVPRPA